MIKAEVELRTLSLPPSSTVESKSANMNFTSTTYFPNFPVTAEFTSLSMNYCRPLIRFTSVGWTFIRSALSMTFCTPSLKQRKWLSVSQTSHRHARPTPSLALEKVSVSDLAHVIILPIPTRSTQSTQFHFYSLCTLGYCFHCHVILDGLRNVTIPYA